MVLRDLDQPQVVLVCMVLVVMEHLKVSSKLIQVVGQHILPVEVIVLVVQVVMWSVEPFK